MLLLRTYSGFAPREERKEVMATHDCAFYPCPICHPARYEAARIDKDHLLSAPPYYKELALVIDGLQERIEELEYDIKGLKKRVSSLELAKVMKYDLGKENEFWRP